ncbi:MAG: TonB-dependent receptor [Flavobacteriales bacterium]|nr:TonB-dependent receptor [Flavobacteriales bacterium]MBF25530.1 TonB-dependent receptor [Flavobacteriales bacterium]|tara:strand:- start:1197 stop:3644 length:2448 start_codon:yes stop_codon:yes gene_type:complete
MNKKILFYIIYIFYLFAGAQELETFTIKGKVLNQSDKKNISNVNILCDDKGTISNKKGLYKLTINAGKNTIIQVVASHQGYKNDTTIINLNQEKSIINKNILLQKISTPLLEIDLISDKSREQGVIKIDPKIINKLPTTTGGIEPIIKLLPGVSSSNELSSQYSVRGGNYDENLIYVNDIEIYKPFLVRNGEQEGLSFINPNMISSIEFSSGGFQAKYGDKLSSVLDVKYKKPNKNNILISTSALGVLINAEGYIKTKQFNSLHEIRYLIGTRIRSNNFLFNSLDTQGDYKPIFKDIQTYITYNNSNYSKWEFSLLNYYSQNKYEMIPQNREAKFGTVQEALQLTIYFEGKEIDNYETTLNAISSLYTPNNLLKLKFTSSFFQTKEQEFYDIVGEYWLSELDNNIGSDQLGEVAFNRGVGAYINHARNVFEASVFNIYHDGKYILNSEAGLAEWGIKYQIENINDQVREWEMVDSAGYSISAINNNDLNLFEFRTGNSSLNSSRFSSYIQFSNKYKLNKLDIYFTGGSRLNYWDFNKELFMSPRAMMSFKPNWKKDFIFNLSFGSYNQSPFFKEYRDFEGNLNKNIKAQKSIHYVINSDYQFKYLNRPFKLTGSIYYKKLSNIIPFEIDNLRIIYLNENNANGYATGIDLKLFGEFVPGVDSWMSISLLKTQEDIEGDEYGFIPRPTDRRLNASIFFQDYFPNNPNYKMQLSLIYGSGLPFGAPKSERFEQVLRIPSYKRLDIGFSRLIKNEKEKSRVMFLNYFKSIWASLEIFNLIGIQNTSSYIWVSDAQNNYYAVPNYLTGRLINVKLNMKF